MPYEAAAKAIFVKANSLAAYRKVTGTGSFATCAAARTDPACNEAIKPDGELP